VPDGRFLSKSIALSEQLNSVSLEAAFLFTWMIPHVDVEGRMLANEVSIKATVVPLREELSVERIRHLLLELARAPKDDRGRPLLYWYDVHGRRFVEFPGFRDHNRGLRVDREAKSRLPNHRHTQAVDLATSYSTTPGVAPGGGPGGLREEVREEVPLSEVKKYVSTSKISDRSGVPVSAGSGPEGPPPADAPEAETAQEVQRRREQIKAGLQELIAQQGAKP
jgi:hypothetical protein